MIDLKRSKKEMKKDAGCEPCGPMSDLYPYGLKLSFSKNEIDKIPVLKDIAVGAQVALQAVGKVVEVRASEREGRTGSANVEIQIQQVDIQPGKKAKKSDAIKKEIFEKNDIED